VAAHIKGNHPVIPDKGESYYANERPDVVDALPHPTSARLELTCEWLRDQ
jgi:hypothetical protein